MKLKAAVEKKTVVKISRARRVTAGKSATPKIKVKTVMESKPANKTRAATRPKTITKSKPAAEKKTSRKPALNIPAILLEGDQPAPMPISGPGQKYVLAPAASVQPAEGQEAELPEAYGTKKLFLAARDPHWLYAHWDLTSEQQRRCNAHSVDRHLVLRIYTDAVTGAPTVEIHVHPESRHWFVHVERAETKYAAELGYYPKNHRWKRICVSGATLTPPDSMAANMDALFATIPMDLPFPQLVAFVKEAIRQNVPLAIALEQLRTTGHPHLPRKFTPPAQWTPAQEKALAAVLSMDEVRRVWLGSLEITELIRRQLGHELSSIAFSPLGGVSSVASPFGGVPSQKGFWFNVNAELIIYGATEPDATVTIGRRVIKLRADGSFSYRFALPDGQYELPIVAVSADQTDARAAELQFSRATEYRGDVGAHPQDPQLKLPHVENVA